MRAIQAGLSKLQHQIISEIHVFNWLVAKWLSKGLTIR